MKVMKQSYSRIHFRPILMLLATDTIYSIRGFTTMRYINRLFTYLLIYLLTYR